MNEETTPQEPSEETPLEPTDETTEPTPEGSDVEPSPSLEFQELQLVNEKIDMIVEEMTKEPTEEELANLQTQQSVMDLLLEEMTKELSEEELAELEAQQVAQEQEELTQLEYQELHIQLLTDLSDSLESTQSIIVSQHQEIQEYQETAMTHSTDQTWLLIFALAIALAFYIFTENLIKW